MLLFAALVTSPAAHAGDVGFPELGEAVPGAEGVTYLDLARLVLPDLEPGDIAHRGREVIDMRHLGGADMGALPPDEFLIHDIAALPLKADGRDRLLLLFYLGEGDDYVVEGFDALALYELEGPPKLLDAAQIGFDRFTSFRDPASIPLASGSDLVLTVSTHFNSSQGYMASAMILVRSDTLELVDTIFTFDDRGCGFERVQIPEFKAGARDGRPYADVAVRVTETTRRTGDVCEGQELPEEGSRRIDAIYRWDEAESRFVPDSDALEILARENEARF
jgi:hypothetical protein